MLRDPLVGTNLGKDYNVIEEIGRGGMAVVYLVQHQTLLKQFAAKVLSAELTANFEARARFTQEAHAASQLDHENIVTISDFGVTSDQRPFFVMELLRGQTLGQRVAEGSLTLEEIVAIAIPIGRALAHAHVEGVVHRDVKPENIFLVQRSQGRWGVKVVDFGIAKAPVNEKLTKMGETLGSPMFMAPEACRGDDVDHRADIYSLGILMYLMFCGRVPFEDESLLKILQMQVHTPLTPPREINPALSDELAAVIERALAKHPDDRFQSMTELLDAFEEALPPGADRLLVEVQRGSTTAIRTTPFPGVTLPARSQPMPRVPGDTAQPPLSSSLPTAPRTNRTLLAIVIASVAFAVFGIVFALQWRDGATKTAPPVVAQTPPAPPPPIQKPRVLSNDQASGSDPVVARVRVEIGSTPPGAVVTLGEKELGVTPLTTEIDQGSKRAKLVIGRRGYVDLTKMVDLSADLKLDVDLAPIPKAEPRKPEPRSEPRKPKPEPKKPEPKKPDPKKPDPPPKGDLDIRLSR